ncbi:hypothetical protein OD91_0890 [Lutibacter sp. Hel_I_33_5]|uniref:hypothetical protein n=1 Tax=Lutibacter sp. Hel_I_33_5 TaxID=1566289 RepID=UPI0011A9F478|nr:hypothetical protein [Lutibacter sp. Hel_I_33_5]TVZ55635.1 hypothetical protein OD91_0890 [Lutibacter sp. Hel_I_33_5]
MKKIPLLLLLISSSLFSQKYLDSLYNFKLIEKQITWQKVFTNIDSSKINSHLATTEFSSTLKKLKTSFTGRTVNTQKRVVKNHPYFATFGFDGFCKIEIKSNKFRVTLKDIYFRGPTIQVYGVQNKQDYPLQNNVIKKNQIKNSKRNNRLLKKLDSIINSKFTIKEEKKDDW